MTKKKTDNLGKKIKMAMYDCGFNQVSLAKKLGLNSSSVSLWVTGKGKPSLKTLQSVAEITGKPLNYFFENSALGDGNQVINGNNNRVGSDKDYALIMAKLATLESKIENLELKYNLLIKGK